MPLPPPASAGAVAMSEELHRWFIERAQTLAPSLAHAIAETGPLWFPEREDHGTAAFLSRAIVGQQISSKAAAGIWSRIEAHAAADGVPLRHYLAAADEAALRACGLSGNKVKAVLRIHAAEKVGELGAREILHGMDHADRSERLCRIWGIGQWTCDMLAIFYCRDFDVWPEGDLAVQRVFQRYIGRRKAGKAAACFAPYRSVLALYMWRLAHAAVKKEGTKKERPEGRPHPPGRKKSRLTEPSRRARRGRARPARSRHRP